MNRRQKIIVSVTGIFIVLLLLVGLTYAYFLTKITGNNNEKSISVTTANLELVYGNGTSNLITSSDPIIPGKFSSTMDFTVKNNGNADIDSYAVVLENYKIAYATTSGEQKKGEPTSLAFPNDFKLKITCTSDKEGKTCSGLDDILPTTNDILLTNSIEMGETQSYVVTLTYIDTGSDQSDDMNKTIEGRINIIDPKTTVDIEGTLASYSEGDYVQVNSTPKVSQITNDGKYKVVGVEPGSHTIEVYSSNGTKKGIQSIEIVKGNTENVSGNTITITDNSRTTSINITSDYNITIDESIKGYIGNKDSLTYNILNNAKNETNGTIYSPTPLTTPAEEINGETEKTLSETQDDYGTSYYYRGNVEDNYVNFAGMCWRIVRIEGDGSTKLILEDYNTTCNSDTFIGNWSDGTSYEFGYDGNNKTDYLNYSGGLADVFKSFQTSKLSNVLNKLKVDNWCYDDSITSTDNDGNIYYGAYTRLIINKKPSLNCTGTKLTKFKDGTDMYVATLTADEVAYAGGKASDNNSNYYLMNDYVKINYLYWWLFSVLKYDTTSPAGGAYAFSLKSYGELNYADLNPYRYARPSITLKSNTIISSGNGTISNPYIVG